MLKHIETHISSHLSETKLVCDSESEIKGTIHFDQSSGLKFQSTIPSEEKIAEFLMFFRFFYLQNERSYFLSVLKILGKHSDNPDLRLALKSFRAKWKNSLFRNELHLKLNDKTITSALLLDLWFNAHYFHSDENKEAELQKLQETFTIDFAKYMLIDSTYEATKLILMVYNGLRGIVCKHFALNALPLIDQ